MNMQRIREFEWVSLADVEYAVSAADLESLKEFWGVVPVPMRKKKKKHSSYEEGLRRCQARRVQALAELGKFDMYDLKEETKASVEAIIEKHAGPLSEEDKRNLALLGREFEAAALRDRVCVGPAAFCSEKSSLFETFVDLNNARTATPHLERGPDGSHRLTNKRRRTTIPSSVRALPEENDTNPGKRALRLIAWALSDRDRRVEVVRRITETNTSLLIEFLGLASDECDALSTALSSAVFNQNLARDRRLNRERVVLAITQFLVKRETTEKEARISAIRDLRPFLANCSFRTIDKREYGSGPTTWKAIDMVRSTAVKVPDNVLVGTDAARTIIADLLTQSSHQRRHNLNEALRKRGLEEYSEHASRDDERKLYVEGVSACGLDQVVSIAALRESVADECATYDVDDVWPEIASDWIDRLECCAAYGSTDPWGWESDDDEDKEEDTVLPQTWEEAEERIERLRLLEKYDPGEPIRYPSPYQSKYQYQEEMDARCAHAMRARAERKDQWISWWEATHEYGLTADDLKGRYLARVPKPMMENHRFGVWRSQARRAQIYSCLGDFGAPANVIDRAQIHRAASDGLLDLLEEVEDLVDAPRFVHAENEIHPSHAIRQDYPPLDDDDDEVYVKLLALKLQALALMTATFGSSEGLAFCARKAAILDEFVEIINRGTEAPSSKDPWLPQGPRNYYFVRDLAGDWLFEYPIDDDDDDDDGSRRLAANREAVLPTTEEVLLAIESEEEAHRRRFAVRLATLILDKREARRQRMSMALTAVMASYVKPFLDSSEWQGVGGIFPREVLGGP